MNTTKQKTRTTTLPPIRVSEDERCRIRANAKAAKLSVSEFVRLRALREVRR